MFQIEQISIVIVTVFLLVSFWLIGKQLKNLRADETPNRLVAAIIAYVSWIDDYTVDAMGEKYGRLLSGYIGSVFIYILVSNLSGLVGLSAPTANFSVTFVFAAITWVMIQTVSIKENGLKGYFEGFLDPFSFFLIPNIFSQIAPLISLSLRLFGNIIAGATIMSLLYTFTGWISQFVPLIGNFNFFGVIIAPILHLYFDLFAGFLQTFIFISLSIIFIGVEIPQKDA